MVLVLKKPHLLLKNIQGCCHCSSPSCTGGLCGTRTPLSVLLEAPSRCGEWQEKVITISCCPLAGLGEPPAPGAIPAELSQQQDLAFGPSLVVSASLMRCNLPPPPDLQHSPCTGSKGVFESLFFISGILVCF